MVHDSKRLGIGSQSKKLARWCMIASEGQWCMIARETVVHDSKRDGGA